MTPSGAAWCQGPWPVSTTPRSNAGWYAGAGGGAVDYYGIMYHGYSTTHVDALCHVWDENGMWQGRKHEDTFSSQGTNFADITAVLGNWLVVCP